MKNCLPIVKVLMLLMATFVCVAHVQGQQSVVSGNVTSDEDGTALPGVNVLVKGTTQGTVTDIEGNYSIEVPDENGTLVFSSIGNVTQEKLRECWKKKGWSWLLKDKESTIFSETICQCLETTGDITCSVVKLRRSLSPPTQEWSILFRHKKLYSTPT